uniref:non-specific serine/threonine protein kinase n=1 Tax=Sinocyclocheilus rhinocerous TaxID=307959 RepID=A0A673I6G1_9TELE
PGEQRHAHRATPRPHCTQVVAPDAPLAALCHLYCPDAVKRQAVKRHHHKHNLKHRYEFLQTLGKGTYGRVKKATDRSGRTVAIKSIRKEKIRDEQDLMHMRREIEIMSSLAHPHIISIHEGTAFTRMTDRHAQLFVLIMQSRRTPKSALVCFSAPQ